MFNTELKRTTVQRFLTGEKTVAELSRELDIVPSMIRTWARRSEVGAATASGSAMTAPSTRRRPRCSTPTSSAWSRSRRRLIARKAVAWPRPSSRPSHYVEGAQLRDAEFVLAQRNGRIADYNTRVPHSALGMRSPAD